MPAQLRETNPLDTEQPTPNQVVLRFGAGLNTRSLKEDIELAEAADGSVNFGLDIDSVAFFRRKPFDLVATAPNGAPVAGYAQLLKTDGTTSTLIQAGSTVYIWDGTTNGFTSVGNVSPNARLRGKLEHNFSSSGIVIITDLALQQQVSQWDGTTFQTMATGLSNPFFAKYCRVQSERAWFANVTSGSPTPHLILAGQVDNPFMLSVGNRPSTSLGTGDAFFIPLKDLSPINGFKEAWGQLVFSSIKGNIFQLTGTDSTNFSLQGLYQLLGSSGDESMDFIGNDLAYGRNGRIESLFAVLSYGNVESAELSRHIAPSIDKVPAWTLVYDRRLYRLYCLPANDNRLFVFHRSMMDDAIRRLYRRGVVPATASPWGVWTTQHPINFQPYCFWAMQNPLGGQWTVYMSDRSGNIYQLEGQGGLDGGTSQVTATRASKLFYLPDGEIFDVSGWIDYQRWFPATVTLTFNYGGISITDQPITINLEASSPNAGFYGGGAYYGGSTYYGLPFAGRVSRQALTAAGRASHWQVTTSVTGGSDFFIDSITLNFNTAK